MPLDGQLSGDYERNARGYRDRWSEQPHEPVILVSNRGPIEFERAQDALDEHVESRRGSGGVVSGLLCAVQRRPVTWIALAMSEADRLAARQPIYPPRGLEHVALRLVSVPPRTYNRYYNGIANQFLWFAQHYLLTPTRSTRAEEHIERDWETGYRVVNERVAAEVLAALDAYDAEACGDVPVLFQDYHLYLAPAFVRARRPHARLGHFVHIPWPDARYLEMLPGALVREIFAGLAACDLVGFQSTRDARNFLLGAERFLPGARVRWEADGTGTLVVGERQVFARAFPIAISADDVRRCAAAPGPLAEVVGLSQQLQLSPEHKLIVRVDRIEPTKNIVRGFQAYERLLRDHPELHGQVTFLALLVPSRQGVPLYRAYERQMRRVIDRINARYGRPGWQPIVAVVGNNHARALACMHRYDVLLVNPLIDGMNLVVKEGGLLNRRHGVIVLSRTAGAYEQLADSVLGIPPLDIRATAEALFAALEMPVAERTQRARAIRALLEREDAASWLQAQVAMLVAREAPLEVPVEVPMEAASWRNREGVHPVPVLSGASVPEAPARRVALVARGEALPRNGEFPGREAVEAPLGGQRAPLPRREPADPVRRLGALGALGTLDAIDAIDACDTLDALEPSADTRPKRLPGNLPDSILFSS